MGSSCVNTMYLTLKMYLSIGQKCVTQIVIPEDRTFPTFNLIIWLINR